MMNEIKVKIIHTSGPELFRNLNCLDNKYFIGTNPNSFNEFQNIGKLFLKKKKKNIRKQFILGLDFRISSEA